MDVQSVTDELWATQPGVIRRFLEVRSQHEKLAQEVAYILKSIACKAGIQIAAVTYRAKPLESFCGKVMRKKYGDPLKQMTDLSGVRLVYLYKSDREKVERVIEKHFKVIEKTDTTDVAGSEKFGYGALHYLVRLAVGASGPRYDELPTACLRNSSENYSARCMGNRCTSFEL